VMEVATIPVITKLTPNVHSVVPVGKAVIEAGSNGISLINTIQSITGIDLDTLVPNPDVGGKSVFGGYCGPAVKPIALKFLTTLAQDEATCHTPISGIGGITTWRDAVEFILLGAGNVQVCTAAMLNGFRIIRDLCDGMNNWMDEKGYQDIQDFTGLSVPKVTKWEELDINFHVVARINQDKCIHCGLCYITCEDTSHQSITKEEGFPYNTYNVRENECVGCNLCKIVCPVDGCIVMQEQRKGDEYLNWKDFQKMGLPLNDH
jgi:dihydropyrimidine dehydrogenase (NAD+) subunit PreA